MLDADHKKEATIQFPGPGPGQVNRASRNSKFRADCWGEEEAPAAKLRIADLYSVLMHYIVHALHCTVFSYITSRPVHKRCLTRPLIYTISKAATKADTI